MKRQNLKSFILRIPKPVAGSDKFSVKIFREKFISSHSTVTVRRFQTRAFVESFGKPSEAPWSLELVSKCWVD